MSDKKRKNAMANQILDTADSLIRRFSYPGLRLEQLSEAAGVSRKTLYNHFPGGKREIWKRCIDRRREDYASRLFSIVHDHETDFVDRSRELLGIGREAMGVFFGPGGLIPGDEDESLFFPDLRTQYVEALLLFFEEGSRLGYVRPGLPLRSLSAAVVTLISDWGRSNSLMNDGECKTLPEFVETVLFRGILTEEGQGHTHRLNGEVSG